MPTQTPKTQTAFVQGAMAAQDATFDAIAKQAAQLGFDEAVLILSNSRQEKLKLVRFHAASETRAVVIVGEAEHLLIEKLSAGAPPLTRPAKVARHKSGGKAVG